jgi:hypothetical protein
MKLIQQVNNLITESGANLVADLRSIINNNATISEDRAHTVAKVMVMWSIIKQDAATLNAALTYDMVCTIVQRVLNNIGNHTTLANSMMALAGQVYGNPKNIVKMQKYIAKLSQQVDSKVNYKIRAMNIASQLLHRHTDPKIKQQLLAML